MTPADRSALRGGVVFTDHGEGRVLRVSGARGWEALDATLPCTMHLRDGQGRQTLTVTPEGAAEADVIVVSDGEEWWLLVDGLPAEVLAERLRARGATVVEPDLVQFELAGPFAWELAGKLLGPALVGLPYLELRPGPVACLRAGRTGEYGYELLVPRAEAAALRERLSAVGAALELREVARDTLDDAALENAFWVPGVPGLAGLDPLALQLRWRLSWDKLWPGGDVLRAVRAEGPRRRLTAFRAAAANPYAEVELGASTVGEVRVVRPAPDGEGVIGYALVDVALAHPGLPGLSTAGGPLALVSPPFVRNLSLFVKPQRHRYANRADVKRG
jgi:glycine cleavage system aminomethyltransferase T